MARYARELRHADEPAQVEPPPREWRDVVTPRERLRMRRLRREGWSKAAIRAEFRHYPSRAIKDALRWLERGETDG